MNWIFEAYSNVYNSAMMQRDPYAAPLAPARKVSKVHPFSLRGLLRRR